jgi:hypothetical protein
MSNRPTRTRKIAQIAALCALVALAGSVGYLLHRAPDPPPSATQLPSFAPLPAHAILMRTETFLQEHVQNWYYSLSQLSEEAAMAFYQAQLPKNGWRCVTSMTNINQTLYNQPLAGTGIYLTALRGSTKAQIYLGDQDYGAWLLQDDLPNGAIALKVSLEPARNAPCV